MSNFHMFLVKEDSPGTVVDDVVVAANDENQARREAFEYFAKDAPMDGFMISPEWSQTAAEPDVRANDGEGSRTIKF